MLCLLAGLLPTGFSEMVLFVIVSLTATVHKSVAPIHSGMGG